MDDTETDLYALAEELPHTIHEFCASLRDGNSFVQLPDSGVNDCFATVIHNIESFHGEEEMIESKLEKISSMLIDAFQDSMPCLSGKRQDNFSVQADTFLATNIDLKKSGSRQVYTIGEHPRSIPMALARVLYTLCKVASPAMVRQTFSCSQELMLPAMQDCIVHLMDTQSIEYEWEVEYILIIWLSVLVKLPFPLCSYHPKLQEVLLLLCKVYLCSSHLYRCAVDLAVAVSLRADTSNFVNEIVMWSAPVVQSSATYTPGVFLLLSKLIKKLPDRFLESNATILQEIFLHVRDSGSSREAMKLLTQFAIRKLKKNDGELHFETREILDRLFLMLKSPYTDVRLQCAKALGTLALSLTPLSQLILVSRIYRFFLDSEDDKSWHGGILALAELTQRKVGLEYAGQMVELMRMAIQFDVRKQTKNGVGSHVRDAACFLLWTVARTCSVKLVNRIITDISSDILFQLCFDREVTVRRAASAAYQELVGRHCASPKEIQVVLATNFHAVANRTQSYIKVASELAVLDPSLGRSFVQRLCRRQVNHWDRDIRILSAKSIGVLTRIIDTGVHDEIDCLLERCTSRLPDERHGSLLALAEICASEVDTGNILISSRENTHVRANIMNVIPKVAPFVSSPRNRPVDYCNAMCNLVEIIGTLSQKDFQVYEDLTSPSKDGDVRQTYVAALLVLLESYNEKITDASSKALGSFLSHVFSSTQDEKYRSEFMRNLLLKMKKNRMPTHLRGQLKLLSCLPPSFLLKYQNKSTELLVSLIEGKCATTDIEARKLAIEALAWVAGQCERQISEIHFVQLIETILSGFRAYDVDYRGEIGYIVRNAASSAVNQIMLKCSEQKRYETFVLLFPIAFGKLLTQLLSKIDAVRCVAQESLVSIIQLADGIQEVNFKQEFDISENIWEFFLKDPQNSDLSSHYVLSSFQPYLASLNETHFKCAVEGLTTSFSSLSAHVTKEAKKLLLGFTEDGKENFDRLCRVLLELMRENRKNYRIISSTIKTWVGLHVTTNKAPNYGDSLFIEVSYAMRYFGQSIHKSLELFQIMPVILSVKETPVHEKALSLMFGSLRWEMYPRLRAQVANMLLNYFVDSTHSHLWKSDVNEIRNLLELSWGEDSVDLQVTLKEALQRLYILVRIDLEHDGSTPNGVKISVDSSVV
ncbi:Beta-tubulin cofactor D [Perkinsela sp. CCAP 1560/4]|nr:Beta-tubulin cofactor D [Perkinsela sp. CCAP 1560/4]|eukprot:KNH07579.1 Beta-tubulin cofactor D [Perkinsela sp. CCAP 1560/4]